MIDLLWTGAGDPPVWSAGAVVRFSDSTPSTLSAAVVRHAAATEAPALLHWGLSSPPPAVEDLEALLSGFGDVWHAGLSLGMTGLPETLDYVAPTWMLNRDPDATIGASSWRLSLDSCLVRTGVVRALGHADPRFGSPEGAALELGHRWVMSGAVVRHEPALAAGAARPVRLSLEDELRFVHRRYGRKWLWYAAWRTATDSRSRVAVVRAARRVHGETPAPVRRYEPARSGRRPAPMAVTVLIPTLDRYPWLETVLRQIRDQTVVPRQVVVVDQTNPERRDEEVIARFADLPLTVLYLDAPGQSSARNAGLAVATGDAVLFIDDDDEIPADLVERHLATLTSGADASCGVAYEPVMPRNSAEGPLRVSDVFPTNNTLLRRDALAGSGGFDLAYDHGIRADHDLGMRLYLSGAGLLLDPRNEVLHHRAPSGGLREFGGRVTTHRGSRTTLLERHRLAPTEVYLARRYFNARQQREMLRLRQLSVLSHHGAPWQRAARFVIQLALMPQTRRQMRAACTAADALAQRYPQIPAAPESPQAPESPR